MPLAYFFRPNFDLATNYMHYWLGLAMGDVRALGFSVIDSQGEYATSYSFFDTLKNYNPDVVIADGHGDPRTLTGQGLHEVLKACVNNEVLSGRVVAALSCLTGQQLGPDSRNKQAQAYFGWVNEFTWDIDPANPYPPTDHISYPFQEIVRKIVVNSCLYQLDRISLRAAYDAIISEFKKWEDYYSVPPGSQVVDGYGSPRASDILICLRHDKNGLITVGKEGLIAVPMLPVIPLASIALGAVATFLL